MASWPMISVSQALENSSYNHFGTMWAFKLAALSYVLVTMAAWHLANYLRRIFKLCNKIIFFSNADNAFLSIEHFKYLEYLANSFVIQTYWI